MKVLVIQHVAWEGPGIIGSYLSERGLTQHIVRLDQGAQIPFDGLEKGDYSMAVALGSPATAYEPATNRSHDDEVRLFRTLLRLGIPSFDICYSMQLFCVANGGRVSANPNGREIGFFDIELTVEGESDPVFSGVGSFRTLQWHGDTVTELPGRAVRLGYSEMTEHQLAVVDGIHYLFQGDGQAAKPRMLESWFDKDDLWVRSARVSRRAVLREAREREAYFEETFRRIFGNFVAVSTDARTLNSADESVGGRR